MLAAGRRFNNNSYSFRNEEKAIINADVFFVCCRLPQLAVLAKILCLLMVSDVFKKLYTFTFLFLSFFESSSNYESSYTSKKYMGNIGKVKSFFFVFVFHPIKILKAEETMVRNEGYIDAVYQRNYRYPGYKNFHGEIYVYCILTLSVSEKRGGRYDCSRIMFEKRIREVPTVFSLYARSLREILVP